MYYEEKFIDGKLKYRITPNGKWLFVTESHGIVANLLALMTEEERLEVFALFCTYCGTDDPECQCWNDE